MVVKVQILFKDDREIDFSFDQDEVTLQEMFALQCCIRHVDDFPDNVEAFQKQLQNWKNVAVPTNACLVTTFGSPYIMDYVTSKYVTCIISTQKRDPSDSSGGGFRYSQVNTDGKDTYGPVIVAGQMYMKPVTTQLPFLERADLDYLPMEGGDRWALAVDNGHVLSMGNVPECVGDLYLEGMFYWIHGLKNSFQRNWNEIQFDSEDRVEFTNGKFTPVVYRGTPLTVYHNLDSFTEDNLKSEKSAGTCIILGQSFFV
jgi:hypothetical protein